LVGKERNLGVGEKGKGVSTRFPNGQGRRSFVGAKLQLSMGRNTEIGQNGKEVNKTFVKKRKKKTVECVNQRKKKKRQTTTAKPGDQATS